MAMTKRRYQKSETREAYLAACRPSLFDKLAGAISPAWGLERAKARRAMAATSYIGASTSRRQLRHYTPSNADADTDISADLPELRERSRDLVRNNPMASGALKKKEDAILGNGLTPKARVDRNRLGLTKEQAQKVERDFETVWRQWGSAFHGGGFGADITLTGDVHDLATLALRSMMENGDAFVVRRYRKRPGRAYGLCYQLIEADRVCNPEGAQNAERMVDGVTFDDHGTPYRYHVRTEHPGNELAMAADWVTVDTFDKVGRRQLIHLFHRLRIGQHRGVPILASVVEHLKMLGKFTESELMAAVIASFYTVFVTSPAGDGFNTTVNPSIDDEAGTDEDDELTLGPAMVNELGPGEEIKIASSDRPSASFEPFTDAILMQIGVALGIPVEVLTKKFKASYSAARAAIQDAWQTFLVERNHIAKVLYTQMWSDLIYESVLEGFVDAPDFFAGPLSQAAYLGVEWHGEAPPQIDPVKAVNAAEKRVALKISTRAEERAKIAGGDWEGAMEALASENEYLESLGLISPAPLDPQREESGSVEPDGDEEDLEDEEKEENEEGNDEEKEEGQK